MLKGAVDVKGKKKSSRIKKQLLLHHQQLTSALYRYPIIVIKELGVPSEQASPQDSQRRSAAVHSAHKYINNIKKKKKKSLQ